MSVEVNIPQEFQVRSGAISYFWNCLLPIIQPRAAHRFHKPWLKISRINWTFNYSIWPCWRGTKLDYPTSRCSGNKPTLPPPSPNPPPPFSGGTRPGARFSKVPIINEPGLLLMLLQDRGFNSFAGYWRARIVNRRQLRSQGPLLPVPASGRRGPWEQGWTGKTFRSLFEIFKWEQRLWRP